MSVEAQAGLAESEPASVTLDSILDKAIAGSDETGAPAAADPGDGSKEPIADKTGRLHGERGKFVAKTNSAAEASDKEPAQAAKAEVLTPAADPAAMQPVPPPARWTAEDQAKFASWPRDVQEAVADRYKAIEADYTRKTQEAAEIRRTAEPLLSAIKPFEGYLSQLAPVVGQQPHEMIRTLLATEYNLRTGAPEQKYTAFAQLANTYGIDLAALAGGQIPYIDPASQQQRQQMSALEQRLAQFEQFAEQQQNQQAALHIDTFSAAKDEAGRPRYPHFERVRGIMGQLMANGQANTIEDAYQKATAPIQEAIAEELRARQQQADTQRKEALAKAEKAAPVRSSGSQPGGSAKGKDLDSILSDAMSKSGM